MEPAGFDPAGAPPARARSTAHRARVCSAPQPRFPNRSPHPTTGLRLDARPPSGGPPGSAAAFELKQWLEPYEIAAAVLQRAADLSLDARHVQSLGLAQIDRMAETLRSLTDADWDLPTPLPFWRVQHLVSHVFVLSGFFASVTRLISTGALQRPVFSRLMRPLSAIEPTAVAALHYSNIIAPRISGRVLSRRVSVAGTLSRLEAMRDALDAVPAQRLGERFPYFRWSVPMGVYLAVQPKELRRCETLVGRASGEETVFEQRREEAEARRKIAVLTARAGSYTHLRAHETPEHLV